MGLRARFFLIIFTVLTIVAIGSVVMHDYFVRAERLADIDRELRTTAAALIDSHLGDLHKLDFESAEKIISEELGESHIRKFFVFRNARGDILYQSPSTKRIALPPFSKTQKWTGFISNGKYVRLLDLDILRWPDRDLQVGIIMSRKLIFPDFFSGSSMTLIGFILISGLFASLFLTSFLLKPVVQLENFLTAITGQARTLPQLPGVPPSMIKSTFGKRDEFFRMVSGLNTLIDLVNRNYRLSRMWAYQMAHELKTPLAIQRVETEKLQKKFAIPDSEINPLFVENSKIASTINSFLNWAELENSNRQTAMFVLHLGAVVETVCGRFRGSHPKRIKLDIQSNPEVVVSPPHLEQLISNLLSNALAYSSKSEPVIIRIADRSISFIDHGPGIPKEVITRIGEPFNRGEFGRRSSKGSGLGLAWVNSICRRYSWKIEILPSAFGSEVVVSFPEVANALA